MKYIKVMVLVLIAFVLGVAYGPWVREHVNHLHPERVWNEWSKGLTRK
jgi:hypothetical protein